MIHHRTGIANQLIQPLRGNDAVAIGIGIDAVRCTGGFAVDGDDEANRITFGRRPQHQMQVAGVETIDDAAVLFIELRRARR